MGDGAIFHLTNNTMQLLKLKFSSELKVFERVVLSKKRLPSFKGQPFSIPTHLIKYHIKIVYLKVLYLSKTTQHRHTFHTSPQIFLHKSHLWI